MGCHSSKDVMARMKKQEAKIDALIKLNKDLEQKLGDIQTQSNSDGRHANETNDFTALRSNIDVRFSKLEKTVGKIHNDMKLKLFEGVVDNGQERNANQPLNNSLSLHFNDENNMRRPETERRAEDAAWKDLLSDSNLTARKDPLDITPKKEGVDLDNNFMDGNARMMKYLESRAISHVAATNAVTNNPAYTVYTNYT